jgi:excisionase family DNA binding protein
LETENNITIDRILLSVEEAALRLGMSKSFVYDLIRTGVIPSYKIGRRTVVKPEDLETFKEELEPNLFN